MTKGSERKDQFFLVSKLETDRMNGVPEVVLPPSLSTVQEFPKGGQDHRKRVVGSGMAKYSAMQSMHGH